MVGREVVRDQVSGKGEGRSGCCEEGDNERGGRTWSPLALHPYSLKLCNIREYLLGLVNIWQLGSLALLADDGDTVVVSLSNLVGLGLSLLCEKILKG